MSTNNAWNSQDPAQVAKGGSGVSSTTPFAVLCGGTTPTSPFQSVASVGTAGQVLTSNGAGALPTFQTSSGGGGILLQSITGTSTTPGSSSAAIPFDNSIPQITEGVEVVTASITPSNASNILEIMAICQVASSEGRIGVALFQDSNPDAIASAFHIGANPGSTTGCGSSVIIFHRMVAGTTASTTFSMRTGPSSGTSVWNRQNAGNIFGGTIPSIINIKELSP
jgi:hypothetical protein